jgi:hypothetical protein
LCLQDGTAVEIDDEVEDDDDAKDEIPAEIRTRSAKP